MKKFKIDHWFSFWALVISIISAGFTVVFFFKQTSQTETISFLNNSINDQPKLCIVDKPKITKIEYNTFFDTLTKSNVGSRLTISAEINLKNIGDSNAKIILFGITDVLSGDPIIRDWHFSNDNERFKKLLMGSDNYYQTIDILPGTTYPYKFTHTVMNIKDNIFNIHLMAIYRNEINNVYDLYYWCRFKAKDLTLNLKEGKEELSKKISESVEFLDDNESYNIYSMEESNKILKIRSDFFNKELSNK